VLVVLGLVQLRFRINGPVYEELARQKDLMAELTPAVLMLGPELLVLHEMLEAKDPAELQRLKDIYRAQQEQYNSRRDHWLNERRPDGTLRLPDGTVRRALTSKAHDPAVVVFRLVDEQFFPALNAKDNRAEAARILRGPILEKFREHRAEINEAVAEL